MVDQSFANGILGQAGLAMVPVEIRDRLLEDQEFLEKFGLRLSMEGKVCFHGGPSFVTSELYAAVIEAECSKSPVTLTDIEGSAWSVEIGVDEGARILPKISNGQATFAQPESVLLLSDQDAREQTFSEMAFQAGLPVRDVQKWSAVISERPLNRNEIGELHRDLADTPVNVEERLSEALHSGGIPHTEFIPESRRYYERLIGAFGQEADIREFGEGTARDHAESLVKWKHEEGFMIALSLASHSSISVGMPLENLKRDHVESVFKSLLERGDMISRLGAVEVGILLLEKLPDLSELVADLIHSILDQDEERGSDGFSDLMQIFIFVESEISSQGVLKGTSPFYRRAASFAQASLIQRVLIREGADLEKFRRWIRSHFGSQYFAQTLVDMRIAPRWHPELIRSDQLKQEFLGRIIGAGARNKSFLGEGRLAELFRFGEDNASRLQQAVEFPQPYYPGPLEGSLMPNEEMPDEFKSIIEEQLSQPRLSVKSFIIAINLANVFLIEDDLPGRIIKILRAGQYHLHEVESASDLMQVLAGLAMISAVSRNHDLARDVRILVRKYRRDLFHQLSISGAYRAIFFAAAAFEELKDWCDFLGGALEELALSQITIDEAAELRTLIYHVCKAEPNLWTSIGVADAALEALIKSQS